jgi:hypothetical protein
MNNNFRLTVHLANQPKVDTKAPKTISKRREQKNAIDLARDEAKKSRKQITETSSGGRYKVYTTISSYHANEDECMKKLADIRAIHEIAIGTNPDKPNKIGKELYQISFVK